MNQKIKLLLKNWLPPIIHEKLYGYRAWLGLLMYAKKEVLNRNSVFKDTASGKRAFLIATGPSLKMEDLKVSITEQCENDKEELKQTQIQNFNSQTTVISSQWKIKC